MKKATIKQIERLTHNAKFYHSSFIKGKIGESATKWCFNDAIVDAVDSCDFWYSGRDEADFEFYGDACKQKLIQAGCNLDFLDSELTEQFKIDVSRAAENADRDCYFVELESRIQSRYESELRQSDCDYFTWTKTGKDGKTTACEFYESDSVMLGATANNEKGADFIYYGPDSFNPHDLIDSRWSPCPDCSEVAFLFDEYNEIEAELKRREQAAIERKNLDLKLSKWAESVTRRMYGPAYVPNRV